MASGLGGAIYTGNGSAVALLDSGIADSSASAGGAVYDTGRSRFFSGRGSFSNCSATVAGGAIYAAGSDLTTDIAASTFTGCSVPGGTGGAVAFDAIPNFTIATSTFTGCSARDGSAVYSNGSTGTMSYTRLVRNAGTAVSAYGGSLAASRNWWGSNAGPGGGTAGSVTSAPWIVLGITADRPFITVAESSRVRANLSLDSDGGESTAPDFLLDGIPVAFSAGTGRVVPASGSTIAGANATTYFPAGPGMALVSATVDDQTVSMPVAVVAVPVTTAGLPTGAGDDAGSGDPPASTPTPIRATVSNVTVGGDSAVSRAVVTGTGIAGLVLTGTRQDGPGTGISPPPGTVYQYFRLVPAGFRSITGATISFTVPQSWLADNRLSPQDIALWQSTAGGWVALPTTAGATANGFTRFTATAPGFPLFAIAGQPAAVATTTPVAPGAPPAAAPGATSTPLAESAELPATAAPVGISPAPVPPVAPAGSLPLVMIAAGILGTAGVATGAVLVRRWWIRRQNPALFREYR
jgi:hypothetical protein